MLCCCSINLFYTKYCQTSLGYCHKPKSDFVSVILSKHILDLVALHCREKMFNVDISLHKWWKLQCKFVDVLCLYFLVECLIIFFLIQTCYYIFNKRRIAFHNPGFLSFIPLVTRYILLQLVLNLTNNNC